MKISLLLVSFALIHVNSVVSDYEPASISAEQNRVHANVNENLTMACQVKGDRISNFTWIQWTAYFPMNEGSTNSTMTFDHDETYVRMTLRLTNVTGKHEGFYVCLAHYPAGSITDQIYLKIHWLPEVHFITSIATGTSSVYLDWWFRGTKSDPVLNTSIQYMKNSTEEWQDYAISFRRGDVHVEGLENGTAYKFRIIASTSVGHSRASDTKWITTWEEDTDFVPNFSVQGTTRDSFRIEWPPLPVKLRFPLYYYKLSITTHDNHFEEVLDETFSGYYIREQLEPLTSYRIKLAACNKYTKRCGNWSTEKEVITVDRDPKFIPNVTLVAVSLDSITIAWSSPPSKLRHRVYQYKVIVSTMVDRKIVYLDKSANSHVFRNLKPGTKYELSVAACGEYKAQCASLSSITGSTSNSVLEGPPSKKTILSSMIVTLVLLVVVTVTWLSIRNRRSKISRKKFIEETLERFNGGAMDCLDPELNMAEQAELLPYNKKWEFPRELLKLDKVLGNGAFGTVRKAEAKSICRFEPVTTVAVKLVRSTASLNQMTALSRELKILAYLGKHPNVVNLLGACTKIVPYGQLLVIVEFCRFGNLHDYLLHRRADFVNQIQDAPENFSGDSSFITDYGIANDGCVDTTSSDIGSAIGSTDSMDESMPVQGDYTDENLKPISAQDLLCWAWQVARGMKFLGFRRVLHGDLAARNILLADNNVVKICDFGMAKALHKDEHYKKNGRDPLPVKWMALESLKDRIFSVHSDIWSYGIVLWELFSLAEVPYPGIQPETLCQELADGVRMARPKYATKEIYQMMLHCWDAERSNRPSFDKLTNSIGDLLDESVKTNYFDLSAPYVQMNTNALQRGERDYLTMNLSENTMDMVERTLE